MNVLEIAALAGAAGVAVASDGLRWRYATPGSLDETLVSSACSG